MNERYGYTLIDGYVSEAFMRFNPALSSLLCIHSFKDGRKNRWLREFNGRTIRPQSENQKTNSAEESNAIDLLNQYPQCNLSWTQMVCSVTTSTGESK